MFSPPGLRKDKALWLILFLKGHGPRTESDFISYRELNPNLREGWAVSPLIKPGSGGMERSDLFLKTVHKR